MKKLYFLILTIIFSGCVSVGVIPLGDAEFYRTDEEVSIYYSRDQIKDEYEEIAILTAKTSDADVVSDDAMLRHLLLKAQEIGADAIIYENQNERVKGGGYFAYGVYMQDTKATFRVTAIRYSE